jgi:hypothetical protein
LCLLAAPLLVAGCSAEPATTARVQLAEDAFGDALASALCDNVADCCREDGFAYDRAKCIAGYKYSLTEWYAPENAGALIYDAEAAQRCVDGAARAARACGTGMPAVSDECTRAYRGSVKEGEACESTRDCAAPEGAVASCEATNAGQRTCWVVRRGKRGDACTQTCNAINGCSLVITPDGSSARCYEEDGLHCSTEGRCEKLPSVGEACVPGQTPCAGSAFCAVDGRCETPRAVGASCADDRGACGRGRFCDAEDRCAPAKRAGAACSRHDECEYGCMRDGTCGGSASQLVSASVCGQ